MSELKIGTEGDIIIRLQKAICSMGFNHSNCTGIFDEDTELSVKHLQEEANLLVNGKVDEETWSLIMGYTWYGSQKPVSLETNQSFLNQRIYCPMSKTKLMMRKSNE